MGEGEFCCLGPPGDIGDGNGVPDSRRGSNRSTPVGSSSKMDNNPELFAKIVIDSRRGITRIVHVIGKLIGLEVGRREARAEYNAIEH